MVKPINITATYKNAKKIFICHKHEFLQKASEWFNIDTKNVVLYAANKRERLEITPNEILDLMKIEIVDKNVSSNGIDVSSNGMRNLRSYFTAESDASESLINDIITKLRNNSTLTGNERKTLVNWLQTCPPSILGKRKRTSNKACQVDPHHVKDSFSQTNSLNIEPNHTGESEDISLEIKRLAVDKSTNNEQITKLMDASFDDRRTFILLKVPPVAVVKAKYPTLFDFEEVKKELSRIFFPGVCTMFLENMEKYSEHILASCNASDAIYLRTMKNINRLPTENQKTYARVVGSIFALSKILDEDSQFIHLIDNPHSSTDVYPHIDASFCSLKEIFIDTTMFHIIVEDQKLCEAPDFKEAILCLVASFFIFNISYPESCFETLTVFEKLFLCANDTEITKDTTRQLIKMLQLRANGKHN